MKIATGQVAVVTGAASGIGLALAERFAQLGLRVVLADLDAPGVHEAAARLAGSGAEVVAQQTDVADPAALERLRDLAYSRFGQVDIICNNAGIVSPFRPLWDNPLADWQRVLDVNLWGVIHGIRAFVPAMVAAGRGHVVNTASMAGLIVIPGNGIYNATKHAVVSLSETLQADLAAGGHAIGVTVLCPGMVATRIAAGAFGGTVDQPIPEGVVYLQPDEVARQVVAAIERNHLYLATHAGTADMVRAQQEQILRDVAQAL